MIIAAFRFQLNDQYRDEFDNLYLEMTQHIAKIRGYLGHKVFFAEDGEHCVIVEFEDKDALTEWDKHPDHKRAKERGKAGVFDKYDVAVASVFERHAKP